MKNQENEIINSNNRKWFNRNIKSPNNRTNSKLLLYHRNKSSKFNLYNPKTQKDINSKNRKKIFVSKENLLKNYKENILNNNNINRPITSNLRQKMFKNIHNSTTIKNYSAKNLTKDSNNSFNVSSKNRFATNIDNNIYHSSSSYRNKNQPIKIKFKMKYSNNSNSHTSQNLINLNSRNNEPSNSNSIYILDLQNENLSFEKIRSLRNLNLHIIQSFEKQNSNQKNIFQKSNSTNTIIIPKTDKKEKKIINYNRIKNNGHDLILYKNVFYSSCPQRGTNNEILNKLRKFNDEIRLRNDKKSISYKTQEKPAKKKYYFYKYKEYMNKIEKEQINAYKFNLKKKKLFSVREIFGGDKKEKETDNQNLNNYKTIITGGTSNAYKKISIKNARKINNNTDDNSSSEMPMIINNYEIRRTGIRKIRRNNTMSYLDRNLVKKKLKQIYFSSNSDNNNSLEHSEENLSAQVNKIKNVDLANFNLNSGEIFEKKNKIKNRLGFNNKKSNSPKKGGVNETDDKKIFEILKKQYYQKREVMIKLNRRNLLAQKLLLQKISELEEQSKNAQKPGKPFFSLNFKYLQRESINQKKKQILAKYYEKNMSKNQFSVRLKSKSGMSFLTNNSAFSSQMNFDPHEKEHKQHEYFNLKDYLNEDLPQKDIKDLDKVDIIKIENEEEDNFDIKEIEKIDSQINFNEIKEEKENHFLNKINKKDKEKIKEKKMKLQFDEEKLNKMIKEEKRKKFENDYFKKYEIITKSHEKKETNQKNQKITPKILEKTTNNFLNLLQENENIIKSIKSSNKNEEEAKLFIDFKEKMNSLAKYSKKELDLYVYRNLPIINDILDECKRDKQKEKRINLFIKLLREDLDEIYSRREIILKYMKVLDYQPFSEYKHINNKI